MHKTISKTELYKVVSNCSFPNSYYEKTNKSVQLLENSAKHVARKLAKISLSSLIFKREGASVMDTQPPKVHIIYFYSVTFYK